MISSSHCSSGVGSKVEKNNQTGIPQAGSNGHSSPNTVVALGLRTQPTTASFPCQLQQPEQQLAVAAAMQQLAACVLRPGPGHTHTAASCGVCVALQ